MQMRFLTKKLQYANFFKVFKFKDFFKIKWKNRVVDGVVEGVQLALAILEENISAEGRLKQFSLIEILLAEGQLKLRLVLTIYSREYFGQRPIETNFSLIEFLLAEGQLKLFALDHL